ncbi:hypothetical protein HNO88_000510 [Novosphingobium chloroacetimidivorans]|uniref:DUF2163 domain-containing protein n=1 Tax=Novosphingobium chloroacetimidivorans TaxID=1428314 RepID=A0A7W7K7V3_9SPHN|nr:hypothetical protein [Novosphingobium chloroacetimidivorans]MBB4857203.1 hypothetical protein [Novosphingobium chloroacetimidivorans]
MERIALISLLRIDLPGATVRLCDGGFIEFDGGLYEGADPLFGTIGSVQAMTEGIGEEIPALELTLLPPETSAPADLSQPGYQRSTVRAWVAEYVQETNAIVGTPDLLFHGQIDQTSLKVGRATRELSITVVSTAERLFMLNEGNSLSPRWHKSIWPGELGHDNAIGLTVPVAWGTDARPGTGGASGAIEGRFFGERIPL